MRQKRVVFVMTNKEWKVLQVGNNANRFKAFDGSAELSLEHRLDVLKDRLRQLQLCSQIIQRPADSIERRKEYSPVHGEAFLQRQHRGSRPEGMSQNRMDRSCFLGNGQDRLGVFHHIYMTS